jgi:hypothetical protein
MPDFDYETLDAGIRNAVRLLHTIGLDTTDSGDGTLTGDKENMECALDFAHVFISSTRERVLDDADAAAALDWSGAGYPPPTVEARYTGGEGLAHVLVYWLPLPSVEEPCLG